MKFWETEEWIKIKTTGQLITDKILSRVEYVKTVGAKYYSDESYNKYLKAMKDKKDAEDYKNKEYDL